MSQEFLGEFIGTAILIVLGNGVVANVVLNKTKGNSSGWIVITFGWAMAVFVAVFVASWYSFAHLNPAVTIGMAVTEKIKWALVPVYIAGQFAGAILGSIIIWLAYQKHFDETNDADAKLAVFCTAPAIRKPINNLITEAIGTFVLVFGAFHLLPPASTLGGLDALAVGLLVFAIGLSLGGPTGYAINPARDLGPRIAHFILPIKNKRDSDWGYSWIPVVGPIVGALIAAYIFKLL
jgi:glycerol uptake facilitator protein